MFDPNWRQINASIACYVRLHGQICFESSRLNKISFYFILTLLDSTDFCSMLHCKLLCKVYNEYWNWQLEVILWCVQVHVCHMRRLGGVHTLKLKSSLQPQNNFTTPIGSKKVLGSYFCVEFICSPRACVGFHPVLWLPPHPKNI